MSSSVVRFLTLVLMPISFRRDCNSSGVRVRRGSSFCTFSFDNRRRLLRLSRISFDQYWSDFLLYFLGVLRTSFKYSSLCSASNTSLHAFHLLDFCRWIRRQSSLSFSTPGKQKLCYYYCVIPEDAYPSRTEKWKFKGRGKMEKYKRIHKELKYRVHMCFNCSRMSQKEAFSIYIWGGEVHVWMIFFWTKWPISEWPYVYKF